MTDRKQYSRDYYRRNREVLLAKERARRAADPKKHSDEVRAWYRKNRDAVLARRREHYQRNKEQRREYNRKYHERNRDRLRAANSERYRKNRDRYLSNQQLKTYGLTGDQYKALLLGQGNACAVCREPFSKRPAVDHDHKTGAVRGLLCGSCNGGLGLFRDNPAFLAAAIAYLRDAASAGVRAA